jgi:adenine deaminase
MNRFTIFCGSALLLIAGPVLAETYDLVINGGRVMDPETSYDAVANVGIRNGRIAIHHQRGNHRQGNHRRQSPGGGTRFH